GLRQPPRAALALRGGALAIDCTCRGRTGCAHGLALVDATLDVVEDGGRAELAAELAAQLYRPARSRALAERPAYTPAAGRAAAGRAAAAIEVWWEIADELRVPTLTAIMKKRTKRGLSAGSRRSAHLLLAEHRDRLPAQDRAIAEALVAWRATPQAAGRCPAQ